MENTPLELVNDEIYFTKTKNKISDSKLNTDLNGYLTTREAAKILGVSKARISQLVKKGELNIKYLTDKLNFGLNKEKYLLYAEEVNDYKNGRVKFNNRVNELNLNGKEFNSVDLTLDVEKEELKKRLEQIIFEMGKLSGLLTGKDEQLRQTNNLLAERAESLIEREAKIKELEAKLEEEKRGKEEALKFLEDNFLKEKEEKEKLKRELLFRGIPWWKKVFTSREEIEKEISKRLLEG